MDIIITILMILVVSRILSGLFARTKQPPVIGELVAGIILGPSILSIISPDTNGLGSCALSIETLIIPQMHNVYGGDEYASNKDMGTLVLEHRMPRLWKDWRGKYSF